MPSYEYYCYECRKRVNIFYRSFTEVDNATPECPACASRRLHRLVSRVAVLKSDERRMENLEDPSFMAGLENEDPRAMAQLMRKMSDEMGEPLDAEMNEVLGRLEAGESPDAIEQAIPELAGSAPDDTTTNDSLAAE